MQVRLFTGKVNGTDTTVNVTLNPRLSGVTKVKVHSFPPGRCVKSTLWVCFDPANEKKGGRLGLHSLQPVGGFQQQIGKDIPMSKEQRQQQEDGGDDLASSSWRVPMKSKPHRVAKRAAVLAASSATTPRTCKCV